MTKEFNLSEKEVQVLGDKMFYSEDIKGFIKRLKEELMHFRGVKQRIELIERIDKLAGDDLIDCKGVRK